MKASGYSYQKIADILNDEGVETKTGKSIWYSKVVRTPQIILRYMEKIVDKKS